MRQVGAVIVGRMHPAANDIEQRNTENYTRREVPTRGAIITVHTFAHTIPNHHALGHRHPSLSELDGDQS